MPPKGNRRPRLGPGAAKSAASVKHASTTAEDGSAQQSTEILDTIPEDPVDPRLTLKGAVVMSDGKLDVGAYSDLMSHFEGEPTPDKHPFPDHPGLRRGERLPKGLRLWDDLRAGSSKDGAGWIAVRQKTDYERKTEKWFNIRQCGSWRMAFLLARLQRMYWDDHAAWLAQPGNAPPLAEKSTPSAAPDKASPSAADEGLEAAAAALPVKRPPMKSAGNKDGAAPKKAARTDSQTAPAKTTPSRAPSDAPQQPQEKTPRITADVVAGSVRMMQILAARKAAQQGA